MGLTLEQARELREQTLAKKKAERKVRVDEIVARSISPETAESRMRDLIMINPEQLCFGIYVLDTVTNDWDDPNRDKILEEVQDELTKKYRVVLPDAEIVDAMVGNQRMTFRLMMRL